MSKRKDHQVQAAIQKAMAQSAQDGAPGISLGIGTRVRGVLDSFKNMVTGLGVRGRDRTTANQVNAARLLTYTELTALYGGSGIAKRITDLIAEDATRAGWSFGGDESDLLGRDMARIGVPQAFQEALKWKRLYGGALTICVWEDERGRSEPLDTPLVLKDGHKKRIRTVRTHSAAEIWIMPTDLDLDPTSPRFEKPTWYTVRRMYGAPYSVHWTRTIEWLGERPADRIAPYLDIYRRYWGSGVFQAAVQSLSDLEISWSSIANLFQESVIGKYSLSNLDALLMEKDYSAIEQRMLNIMLSKSTINGVLLGAEEKYERDELKFTGVADVLDRMMMRAASEFGYPVSILFCRGPAGMNATGEGDARQYYDMVGATQQHDLRPPLLQLARWIQPYAAPDVDPDQVSVTFRPVWSPSEKELVEMFYKMAQSDALNVVNHILTPEEVRKNRYTGEYSWFTTLPVGSEGRPAGIFYDLQAPEGGSPAGEGPRNTIGAQVRTPSGSNVQATAQTRTPKAGNAVEEGAK